MKKPYVPRPAGRHIVDPKTGQRTRSGPFTAPSMPAAPVKAAMPAPEAAPAAPATPKGK